MNSNFSPRLRHAADKLQKTENVMEKYKKKLEESADLRRRIKVCHLGFTPPNVFLNLFIGSRGAERIFSW